MASKTDRIAIFDSGVGGISVLRELVRLCPGENYLYFGDSAHAPYGEKTTQQVQALTLQAAQDLLQQQVKALVIACNTATAAAIDLLRKTYPDMVIIGIEPAIKLAVSQFPAGRIGVMATSVTLHEDKLANLMAQFPQSQVERIPAPGLVELIEQGKTDAPETQALLADILAPYQGKLDALVLGCTHYPFVKGLIQNILGERVALLDGSEGTARQTIRCLREKDLLNEGQGSVTIQNSLGTPELLQLSYTLLDS